MPHLPDRHQDHDATLVAALAAGDATGGDHERASELVAGCAECAALRDDLVLIARAVHDLPAPRRTRDYRLTEAGAATLRPTGWRRLLGAFGGPRFRLAAPLGTTLATLGLAGLLVSAMPAIVPVAGPATSMNRDLSATFDAYGGNGALAGGSAAPEATDGANVPAASFAPSMAASPSAAVGERPVS